MTPSPRAFGPLPGLDFAVVMRGFLLLVLVLLATMLLAVLTYRLTSTLRQSRRERLVQATRPLLLGVLADEEPESAGLDALAALPDRRWRALEPTVVAMLGKIRGDARGALVDVLARRGALERAEASARSRSWVRRCDAAEMLGAARDPRSIPLLVSLLDDRNAEVRRVAARSLGRVGVRDAARPLLDSLVGDRALAPREAAAALVLLEPAATPTIAEAVAGAEDPRVRSVGVEVLGLRASVEAAGTIARFLDADPHLEVRIRSARALGRIGVRGATGPLTGALGSESPELRAVSARALGALGAVEAVEALTACLADPWHRVAGNAAESLASLGPPGRAALERVASGGGSAGAHAEHALALLAMGREPADQARA